MSHTCHTTSDTNTDEARVHCSKTELLTLLTQAALSKGLPQSYASLLAQAAVWLPECGLPAEAYYHTLGKQHAFNTDQRQPGPGLSLQPIPNEQLLLELPVALDLLAVNRISRIQLLATDTLWVPLALLASHPSLTSASLVVEQTQVAIIENQGAYLQTNQIAKPCAGTTILLQSESTAKPSCYVSPQPKTRYTLLASQHHALSTMASELLVKSNSVSRQSGAGAGLLDND